MFAVVVPGRAAQQAAAVPDAQGQFVITLEQAEALNHICVFQTAPLPDGYGCTLHLDVGNLSNDKPSAIFRLRGNLVPSSSTLTANAFANATPTPHLAATLGILCEPLASVQAHLSQLPPSAAAHANAATTTSGALVVRDPLQDPTQLAMLVAKNMFNAIGGFAQQIPGTSTYAVELGVIEKWYTRFVEKVKAAGVGFLMQQD